MVDNNDDIESEDDNDSEPPEASSLPGNADADTYPDSDPAVATLPSPRRHTPPDLLLGKGATHHPSTITPRGISQHQQQLDAGGCSTMVLAGRSSSGSGSGGGNRGGGRAENITGAGNRARGYCDNGEVTGHNRERARGWGSQTTVADSGGGGSGGGENGGGTCGPERQHHHHHQPWSGIGWEQGETGSSAGGGGTVRRWGRVVEEAVGGGDGDGDDASAIGSAELEELAVEQQQQQQQPLPAAGQGAAAAAGKRVELRRGDSEKNAGAAEGNRWSGRGKGHRSSSSSTRDKGASGVEATIASGAVDTGAGGSGNLVGGETPPPGRRKERRRGSGLRGAKTPALGNGEKAFFCSGHIRTET